MIEGVYVASHVTGVKVYTQMIIYMHKLSSYDFTIHVATINILQVMVDVHTLYIAPFMFMYGITYSFTVQLQVTYNTPCNRNV